jgi:transcriptional regulator with XRE-family HTH domain
MSKPAALQFLAENLRAYRAKVGISQEELAHQCGLHRTYVGSIERAERNVTVATLSMLARVMKVEVPVLLTRGGIK